MVIGKALKKYGSSNAIFEVIAMCKTQDDTNYTEVQLIKQYDSIRPHGYNIEEGGRNAPMAEETKLKISESLMRHLVSNESKEKMSQSHKGKKIPEEQKRKISEALKGRPGRSPSEETRHKMSKSRKGKIPWNKGKSGTSEKRWTLTINEVQEMRLLYEKGYSYREIGEKFNISRKTVSNNIKRIIK